MSAAETDKRSAILHATLDLIAERGFHGTPMSQVAKRSSVSTGIIYHYFENKDDLIRQLYRHVKSHFADALMQQEPQNRPFPENLKQMWLNAYRFYVSYPKETLFLEQYENSPYWHGEAEYQYDPNVATLTEMVHRTFADGSVREMPLPVLQDLTLGVALSLAKRQINGSLNPTDADLEAVAAACSRAVAAE